MAEDAEDKTEDPSSKKLEEAREKGQIGRSMDLSSAALLGAGLSALMIFGDRFVALVKHFIVHTWDSIATVKNPSDEWVARLGYESLVGMLNMIWPILTALLLIGVSVNLAQVGLNFSAKPLEFKLSKIFNIKNLTRPFSKKAWIELLKGVFKITVIGFITYKVVLSYADDIAVLNNVEFLAMVSLFWSIAVELMWKVILFLFILGAADLLYQKQSTFKELKMTKQEVKEETKNTSGDPKMQAARKRVMMKMYQQFMSKEVPKATVVITNPTYIAIAIRYERGHDNAPLVVAKGKRLQADRIRQLAYENDVPVVENKTLARGMYDFVEVGDEVPEDFYEGVAEVLAYVFTMDQKKAEFV